MNAEPDLSSGKGHRDENFPVASFQLKPEHRAPVMAFYRFARASDDISDHEDLPAATKLDLLGKMRDGLDGKPGGAPRVRGRPGGVALAVHVEHVTPDRHCRVTAIVDQPGPIVIPRDRHIAL